LLNNILSLSVLKNSSKNMHFETKVNILLVGDDRKNLLALEALLESLNQNLVTAHSGDEALKCLRNQDFAVIILDVEMAQMDGFETARLIRKRRASRHTPIIFLTAIPEDNSYVKRGYALGAVDYLLKPIVPEILLSKVTVLLSLFQKTQEVKQQAAQLEAANIELQREIAKRQQAEEALRKANDELEIKVKERTSQLAKSNKSLRAEIAERKRAEESLQQQIRRDRLMAATLEHIRRSLALDQILTTTVTEVQQLLKADRVLIYRLCPDGTGKVVAEAVNSAWSATLEMILPEESFPRQCYEFYCQGQPRVVPNVVQHEWAECLLEFLQQLGVKSEAIAPIVQSVEQGDKIQNNLWGLLIIHACSDYREWQQEEVDLLTCIAKHLAIAIQQAELYQQLQVELVERKQAEESRLALESQKELQRAQLRFFSMASHAFRTPLGAILGSAQILESAAQSCSDSKRIKNIQRIKAAAKNLTQMLDDILTINRAETGKIEVNPRPIELEKFCQNLVEEMQLIAGSKTPITFVSQGECQMANLDKKLLGYILNNLILNAINYSPKGGDIQLALTCEQKAVTFQIKDHGIGIPPEDQNHLFELFHRGKNIENIPGRGLGLSVVKKSVELQGGKISLQSEEGVGTTVTVTIPQ
jgi:signal transduction histidine kinase/DNA-binding response OmpR family regulator